MSPSSTQSPGPAEGNSLRPQAKNAVDEMGGFEISNLWIGNLNTSTTDSDLNEVFGKFGSLDSVCSYSSRNFAFIYFKRPEDAKKAKESLQGTLIRGNPVKIEFARPARPSKQLWVGGICSAATKEQLENEFGKFGKIEDFKLMKDRNSALVSYYAVENAAAALKALNGKKISGESLRVDFLRSSKRDWNDSADYKDGPYSRRISGPSEPFWAPHTMRNFVDPGYGGRRMQGFGPGNRDDLPSKVLLIRYPPSVEIDELRLREGMILYGEIEDVRCFPDRHYAFVEFRSIEEAAKAKEAAQGRLLGDPRIQILFSNSEGGHGSRDNTHFFPGMHGVQYEMLYGESPFGPMDMLGRPHAIPPGSVGEALGPSMLGRPLLPQHFDPTLANPDNVAFHPRYSGGVNPISAKWTRTSPPSVLGARPLISRGPGAWDEMDALENMQELKRSRLGSPIDGSPFHPKRIHGVVSLDRFGYGARSSMRTSIPHMDQRGILGPKVPPFIDGSDDQRRPSGGEVQYIWRGVITKGGNPVCHARCLPVESEVDVELPPMVNCSSKTSLEKLSMHYMDATGFGIVFFLPDNEDEFAAYTELLRYLGGKGIAGVAKLDDGTDLFLVPPSDFLTDVLKVSGPPRLYGVVLRFNQETSSATPSLPPPLPQPPHSHPQYDDRQHYEPIQNDYANRRNLTESLIRPTRDPRLGNFPSERPVEPISQAGVPLTPDTVATLTTLMPSSSQPSPAIHNTPLDWRQAHHQVSMNLQDQGIHANPRISQQYVSQSQALPQYSTTYSSIGNPEPTHIMANMHVLDPSMNAQQGVMPTTQVHNYPVFSQGGHYVVPQGQQYQLEYAGGSQNYAVETQNTSAEQLQQAVLQPGALNQNMLHQQVVDNNPELQAASVGSSQLAGENEADKNQRYQSTLQFAANLLLQIQQQQSQTAQAAQNASTQ